MQIKTRYWLLIIAAVLICCGVREGCNQSGMDKLVKEVVSYSDTAKYERLKNGALVSVVASLKLESQAQFKSLVNTMNDTVKQMFKRFKSVNNITYVTNNFTAGGDTSKYPIQIPCDFKPFKVGHTDSTYTFRGTVAKDYFSVDFLSVPNKISIITGRKKVGFMKYDYAVDINNSNPLMVATNIKSYQYSPQKKWYEKTWVHVLTGFGLGTIANQAPAFFRR